MNTGTLNMSADERERLYLSKLTGEGSLTQRTASERLGISERQCKRLVRRWKLEGDAGLVSRQRGNVSNNRLADADRARILERLRERYPDFGSTLAVEKLLERDGIKVSRETVRRLRIAAKLWRPIRTVNEGAFLLCVDAPQPRPAYGQPCLRPRSTPRRPRPAPSSTRDAGSGTEDVPPGVNA
jgi:transposase